MKQLSKSVYYTGTLNPNMRVFDVIMRTEYGTSYNSYIIKGASQTALIETSHASFWDTFKEDIDSVLNGRGIDFLILNHTEPDHSGCVARLLQEYPNLTIVCSQPAALYLKNITNIENLKIQIVRDGDTLCLGDKTLRFINAPFLHWPDSMFTWLEEDNFLFSCDFLGCHFCEPEVFDTRIHYPEKYQDALKYYYDCIFGPFPTFVQKGLEKIKDLPIRMICPSHGPILTSREYIANAMWAYKTWSASKANERKLIPLFYCTAYGNTAKLAEAIRKGILRTLPNAEVNAYNLIEHTQDELAALLNSSDAFLIGALTINRDAVPPIWQLLSHVDAINIAKRPAALFGSYGWSGEGFANTAERLKGLKCKLFDEQFKVNFVPSEADLAAAEQFGAEFAKSL
ncbi:MAG: FprA family A-type flavoprotein [Oscillospiraceae bacterium]|jgi:flavorubredoxin|nr:FprA family A-type flavoprotein [Oscillospiraceae bacterium]